MKLKTLGFAAILIGIPAISFAQDAMDSDTAFVFNSFLLLFAGIMVFFMHIGFAMLEGGIVREKNLSAQMLKNIGLLLVSMLVFVLLGYNIMYPLGDWMFEGLLSGRWGFAELEPPAPSQEQLFDYFYATSGSDLLFQMMFCSAAASIVSGAVAERMKIRALLVFTAFLTAFIYPIQGSWDWGGGFLDTAGFLDFAGATVVHSVGGWAALTGAIILGPRIGRFNADGTANPIKGSSITFVTLGAFMLWIGWFGFNGGSQLALGSVSDVADVSRIFVNTNAAAIGGGLTALLLCSVLTRGLNIPLIMNGSLGGLVAITAEPLQPPLIGAVLIGAVGGALVVFGVRFLEKMQIDDTASVVPVHLFAGIFGTLIAALTNADANFTTQLFGVVVYGIATVSMSSVVWLAIKYTIGLRVSRQVEEDGLDSVLGPQG